MAGGGPHRSSEARWHLLPAWPIRVGRGVEPGKPTTVSAMRAFRHVFAALVLLAGISAIRPVHAAESYDNCAGFIDTLPATISTQGVWCLRKDLATNIASGKAIAINANNITVDCNGYKLGGLAAGTGTQAVGIQAYGRQNVVIRHCNVRGFLKGIEVYAGAGQLIEDNALDNNTQIGLTVWADNSILRNNRVRDTGGSPLGGDVIGIEGSGEPIFVNGNYVSGTFGPDFTADTAGIAVSGYLSRAYDNTIYGTLKGSGGIASGLDIGGTATSAERNLIGNVGPPALDYGINTTYSVNCFDNRVYGATSAYDACNKVSGNYP